MLAHQDIWRGLEELARREGCSISGLARRAGLDATTFNRSKRVTSDGKERWPSTESIARVLEATGTDLIDFAQLAQPLDDAKAAPLSDGQSPGLGPDQGPDQGLDQTPAQTRIKSLTRPHASSSVGVMSGRVASAIIPLIDQDCACRDIPFDDEGIPVGQSWEELPFPAAHDGDCFAIEITDDRAAPAYQAGDQVIVSPLGAMAAMVRRGDRLMMGTAAGDIVIATLVRQTPRRLDLALLGTGDSLTLERADIRWMGRILWVSQ